MQKLAGKTALITGGASGVGLGMARAFIAAGLRVAIADANESALETIENPWYPVRDSNSCYRRERAVS